MSSPLQRLRSYGLPTAVIADRHGAEWVISHSWFARRRLLGGGDVPYDVEPKNIQGRSVIPEQVVPVLRQSYARRQWATWARLETHTDGGTWANQGYPKELKVDLLWSDGEIAYATAPWFEALHEVCGNDAVCWQPRLATASSTRKGRREPISWWTADDRVLLAVLMPRLVIS